MVKNKNKNISKSTSEKSCVFCSVKMERRTRTSPPQGKRYYYTAWDVCPLCHRIFHSPEFMCEEWKQSSYEYSQYQKKESAKRKPSPASIEKRKENNSLMKGLVAKQMYKKIKEDENFWSSNL